MEFKSQQPTLSILMTNYNHARWLPESLAAIVEQSSRALEIIVIDDGSTDNSVEVIQYFAKKEPRLRFIRNEQNMGTVYNAARLLEYASGDYVYFGAADDRVLPGLFEKSMSLLVKYPHAALCSAMSWVIDAASGKKTNLFPFEHVATQESYISPSKALSWLRQRECWVIGNTCVLRRDALINAGGFIPELGAFIDGFIYMVLALRHGACFIPEPLAIWRLSTTGYANTLEYDPEISLKVWSLAADLMRTRYADLFPIDWVNKWEEQKVHYSRIKGLRGLWKQQMTIMRDLFRVARLLDRVFLTMMSWSIGAVFLMLLGYLMLRRGPDTWPLFLRWARVFQQRFAMRVGYPYSGI